MNTLQIRGDQVEVSDQFLFYPPFSFLIGTGSNQSRQDRLISFFYEHLLYPLNPERKTKTKFMATNYEKVRAFLLMKALKAHYERHGAISFTWGSIPPKLKQGWILSALTTFFNKKEVWEEFTLLEPYMGEIARTLK